MIVAARDLRIEPVTGALGAEILGIDIASDLDDATIAAIRQALLEHCVIFFRDQELDIPRQKAFTSRFGTLFLHPNIAGSAADPAVIDVVRNPGDKKIIGEDWHSDTPQVSAPPMGSLLYAVEVPAYGGDTMFANQYLAYETLSDGLKQTLDGLIGVSSSSKADVTRTREDALKQAGAGATPKKLQAEHPLVRSHPETGRKALYTSVAHTAHIKGWTEQESLPLLEFLWQHQVKPEFTCRFQWAVGSLAFWDNRCAMHNPINDYHGFRRVMHRITLAGDTPR